MKKTITSIAILIFITISTAFGNISGIYYGEYDGSKVACQLEQQGSQLAGVIQDDAGNTFEFNDMLVNGAAKGTMVVNGAFEVNYAATFSASICKLISVQLMAAYLP